MYTDYHALGVPNGLWVLTLYTARHIFVYKARVVYVNRALLICFYIWCI